MRDISLEICFTRCFNEIPEPLDPAASTKRILDQDLQDHEDIQSDLFGIFSAEVKLRGLFPGYDQMRSISAAWCSRTMCWQ